MADLQTAQTINAAVAALTGKNRRRRQEASRDVLELCEKNPELILPHLSVLIDALEVGEAQTRWQLMDTLCLLAPNAKDDIAEAFDGAEDSLFDEDSSTVRLAAFRLLAKIGSLNEDLSKRAWALLDEAVQCYHGDVEYRDMLAALIDFAKGAISDDVAKGLADRVSFDAENASGYIKSGSQEILDELARRS